MKPLTILGAALMFASSIAAAQGYGQGMGGQGIGMMGGQGMGMMGGQGMGMQGAGGDMFAALNLTDEQREKIASIREQNRTKNWAAMGEARSEQFKLRSMYRADKLDADKIVEQQKKVDELRRQMLKSRVEAHNQMAAVLTPEQRKLMRQHAPWWRPDEHE
jgi:Spy/CpxP family protein refolding chaperone